MNARKMWLCWSVAACIGLSSTSCSRKDSRDPGAAEQAASPATDLGFVLTNSPEALIAEQIRTRVEAVCVGTELRVCGDPVYASEALPGFYVRRLNRPAWSSNGRLSRRVSDLVNALQRADLDGLRSEDYHLAAIRTLLAAVRGDIRNGRADRSSTAGRSSISCSPTRSWCTGRISSPAG